MKKTLLFILLLAAISVGYLIFVIVNSKRETSPVFPISLESKNETVQISEVETKTLSPLEPAQLTENNKLIGINKNSQISIFDNYNEQIVYINPVSLFSYRNGVLAVLDKDKPILSIIDINTKQVTNNYNLSPYLPIVSISLSLDGKSLYFLGKYNSNTYESNIYVTPTVEFNPSFVVSTKTTKIDVLEKATLLASRYTDGPGSSYAEIIDVLSKRTTKRFSVDSYSISPTRKRIAISLLSRVTVFDISKGQLINPLLIPTQKPSFLLWEDESIFIVISNNENAAVFYKYDLKNIPLSPEVVYTLNANFVRSVISNSSKTIVILDKNDKVYMIGLN